MKQNAAWLKLSLELLKREDLSLSAKLVYAYMLWRCTFFMTAQKTSYFEAQDTIARECNLSRKTVNESIQKLSEVGLIQIKKSKMQTSTYVVLDKYKIYASTKKNNLEYLEPF